MGRLDSLDLTQRLGRKEYDERLAAAQRRWLQLRLHVGGQMGTGELGPGCCSCSRAATPPARAAPSSASSSRSTRGTTGCTSFAKPTFDEKRHPFLWRFYPYVPGLGGMSVFDRSWYGRVLVERIEGFATDEPVGSGLRGDRQLRARQRAGGRDHRQVAGCRSAPRSSSSGSRTVRTIRCGGGRSPRRTGATAPRPTEYLIAAEEMFERTDHHLAPWDVIVRRAKATGPRPGAGDGDPPGRAGHDPLGHGGADGGRSRSRTNRLISCDICHESCGSSDQTLTVFGSTMPHTAPIAQ